MFLGKGQRRNFSLSIKCNFLPGNYLFQMEVPAFGIIIVISSLLSQYLCLGDLMNAQGYFLFH